jgi:hypothetical protein
MRRLAIVIALALLAREAPAQGARLRQTPPAGQNAPRRQQLEARLRQGLWRITKNRVGLTDEQMTKLAQTSRPFDAERRRLAAQERDERLALRREILAGPSADQQHDEIDDARRREAGHRGRTGQSGRQRDEQGIGIRERVRCVDDEERMPRVEGMRDELPHHGAVLPEVADPVAVCGVQ